MRLFLLYLKRHIKVILLTALFVGIFALVFSLYQLPVEAVWYAALLCVFVGAVLFAIGFGGYMRRHRELKRLEKRIAVSLCELPEPRGELERDYQDIITLLLRELSAARNEVEAQKRDSADYYALWAHQIKTPISAMRLLLQEQEDGTTELDAQLSSIERYVEMVLSYQRLDASDYVLREYSLDDIVRSAIRRNARLFVLRKLPLYFEPADMTVLTDEKWLLFVVEQLLSNSLKYTRSGGIHIYCECGALCIADTGIGIRAEDLPRVFEKGFTGYNGREDKKSTGIGLYLSRRVCEKIGCCLTLSSEPGRGTTARLSFPERGALKE